MALNSGSGGGSVGGIRAGNAFVTLWCKNNLAAGLNAGRADLKAFGGVVSGLGRTFLGLGAAGAASLIPMAGALSDIAKQGAVGNALGLTAEQFTGIAGIAKSAGSDTKEFTESLVTLGKLGSDAAAGTEMASQAFANLGLNAADFIKLRADEQFFAVFDSLSKMEDPLSRVRVLMQAFGEDGGKLLLPLLGKSSDELRNMAKGFQVSSADMGKATEAAQSYAAAGNAIGKAWDSLSISAAPFVKAFGENIATGAGFLRQWIDDNREVVVGTGLAVGGLTAVGLGLAALGPAITAASAGWGLFSSAAAIAGATVQAAFVAPILAIPAALAGAGAAWLAFADSGKSSVTSWANAVGAAFGPTIENLKSSWVSAVELFSGGDMEGAFRVGLDGLKVEWARLMLYFQEQWAAFKIGWERSIDATGIALVRLGRRVGVYSAQEAADIEKTLLQMNAEGEKRLANPMAVREARVELANAMDWQKWNLKEIKAGKDWIGAGGDWGASLPAGLSAQIASITAASRGGFGGSINAGVTGMGGGGALAELKKANQIAEQTNKILLSQGRYQEAMGFTVQAGG